MSTPPLRSSKFWLYFSGYVVLLVGIAALFLVDRSEHTEPEPVEDVVEIAADTLICDAPVREGVGGVLALMPPQRMFEALRASSPDCSEEMCERIRRGERLEPYFLEDGDASADACLSALTHVAVDFHNEQLEDLPLISFFYDAGVSRLTSTQMTTLNTFLKAFRKAPNDYGYVVLGRASAIGNSASNQQLSEQRGNELLDAIEANLGHDIHTTFLYFGDRPPRLTVQLADLFGIQQTEYEGIRYGRGRDTDFRKRLNQSVVLVVYPVNTDPFGLLNPY